MYQFSRAIYRELAPQLLKPRSGCGVADHQQVLRACETVVQRLASDRDYFARPARTLFADVRSYFPVSAQHQVYEVIQRYLTYAEEYLASQPRQGYDAEGRPVQCRATTRRGAPCQRMPLPHNGYCPSHQHLAETEHTEVLAA